MTCTTFLHDSELNKPTTNPHINELLGYVRQETGENWQVIEREVELKAAFWQKKKKIKLYEVFKYVGGIGPWQCINFCVPSSEENSLAGCLGVESFVIINYMYGILAGAQAVERKHVSEKAN
jgi:hypothetical protein